VRERSQDVDLFGFKITAIEGDQTKGRVGDEAEMQTVEKPHTLFFLHGLMSQGRSWRSFSLNDEISTKRDVFLLDLRNHGESDHHKSMTYEEMATDVIRFADQRELEKVTLIGHNIGGKTAMVAATLFPDRVAGLISLDTAPTGASSENKAKTLASIRQI